MTLNTKIFIQGEINRLEVFAFCQKLIAEFDDQKRPAEKQLTEDSSWGSSHVLMNQGFQGLPAWLMVHYNPDGMLVTPEQSAAHDDDCNVIGSRGYSKYDPECDGVSGYAHRPHHWLEVSFDTGYGYSNSEKNWDCTDLHSYYITRLGVWLDERKIPWSWENEYTGEIHIGYDGLKEFGKNGMEAAQWFTGTVLPAIASGALLKDIDRD